MKIEDLRTRLVLAITLGLGATSAACGSDVESPTPVKDASTTTDAAGTDSGLLDAGSDANGGDLDSGSTDSGGDANPTVRRPFLVDGVLRSATAVTRADWVRERSTVATELDTATRVALGKAWLEDGLQEHASVAAFARFAMQLLAVGAPADLVEGAHRAALDEIAHAKACFALASRYSGGRPLGPDAIRIEGTVRELSLADLAALAAEEGCVGETLGAAIAAEQLAVTTDPEVRRVLEKIARDEARHAELAWRFVAWASAKDASVLSAVDRAVERALASARAMPIRTLDIDADAWHAHGRLACIEARAAMERAIEGVLYPALSALSSHSPEERRSSPLP